MYNSQGLENYFVRITQLRCNSTKTLCFSWATETVNFKWNFICMYTNFPSMQFATVQSGPSMMYQWPWKKLLFQSLFKWTLHWYQFGCVLKMVGPKMQKNHTMNYGSSKSAKIVLSKSIFYVKNRRNFFKKK